MIILEQEYNRIKDFIGTTISQFKAENQDPGSIGIYCCPWSGWLSMNFNGKKTLADTFNNCPDFEFVEFALLDLTNWAGEYESDNMSFRFGEQELKRDADFGDEKLNVFVFTFLATITTAMKKEFPQPLLLQMLDSGCCKVF